MLVNESSEPSVTHTPKIDTLGIQTHIFRSQQQGITATANLIGVFAWVYIAVILLLTVFLAMTFGPLTALPALISVLGGLLLLAFAKMTKALGVIADQTRETMNLTRTLVEQNRSKPN